MDIEVIYTTEFGSSLTTMKINELASWIKRYNFKILSIEEQKQSYSEEEVLEAFDAGESFGSLPFNSMTASNRLNKNKWFKELKTNKI